MGVTFLTRMEIFPVWNGNIHNCSGWPLLASINRSTLRFNSSRQQNKRYQSMYNQFLVNSNDRACWIPTLTKQRINYRVPGCTRVVFACYLWWIAGTCIYVFHLHWFIKVVTNASNWLWIQSITIVDEHSKRSYPICDEYCLIWIHLNENKSGGSYTHGL